MIDPYEEIHNPEECSEQMTDPECTLKDCEVCNPPAVEAPNIEQIL